MAYENTGKALATKWDYVVGDTKTTQKLLNTAGVELEPNDIQILTDEEYEACLNYTINYMKNTLKWQEVPSLSTSVKTDLVLCPLPSPPVPAETRIIEVKFETYETGNRKYRIFFASESVIPTDMQIKVTKVNPAETSTVTVTSSIVSAGGLSYTFSFPDGSTSKTVGNITYQIAPTAITLPRDNYAGMIFYAPFTDSSDLYIDLVSETRATEHPNTSASNGGVGVSNGYVKFNLPLDMRQSDYTFSLYAMSTMWVQGSYRPCIVLYFPDNLTNSNPIALAPFTTATVNGTSRMGSAFGYWSTNDTSITAAPTRYEWTHFVGCWDHTNNRFYIYVNKSYADQGGSLGVVTPSTMGSTFLIGGAAGQDDSFTGYIKEVKVWDRLLTTTEINAL